MNTAPRPMDAWQDIPWRNVERAVCKRQQRIYRASRRDDVTTVDKRHRLWMKSWYAKLLAARRVTQDHRGRRSAGVDGVQSLSPPQRLRLAQTVSLSPKAQPVRRVWIAKSGPAEVRPLGMPVMADRAGQALAKRALEPEWEAKFEPNSYGFRPGRSCHDALAALHASIHQQAKYVLEADIETCFDRICHQALGTKLPPFPALRRTITAWLKAGVMDGAELFPPDTGAPPGGVVSPRLMHVALHGLETALTYAEPASKDGHRWQPRVIRFADALVVFPRDDHAIVQAQDLAARGRPEMGGAWKPRKTRIGHTLPPGEGPPGFDFLSFHVRPYPMGQTKTGKTGPGIPLGFKTLIRPSKAGQRRHIRQMHEEVRRRRAPSQEVLMHRLKPIIGGWSNYDATVASKATFVRMDTALYANLRRWAQRRHPNKSAWWISEKYWPPRQGQWTCKTPDGRKLERHSATPSRRYTKVTGTRSPYDGDWGYWASRRGRHPETPRTWAILLKRQGGRCVWCGLYFKPGEDVVERDHLIPKSQGGDDTTANLQRLHGHCHDVKTAQDKAVEGPPAKSHIAEEPGEAQDTCTVLKPSQRG